MHQLATLYPKIKVVYEALKFSYFNILVRHARIVVFDDNCLDKPLYLFISGMKWTDYYITKNVSIFTWFNEFHVISSPRKRIVISTL